MWNSVLRRYAGPLAGVILLVPLLPSLSAQQPTASPADEMAELRDQIRQLDQKLRALEAAASPSPSTSPAAAQPSVAVDRRGLVVESADKAFNFRIRPRVQVDGRVFPDESDGPSELTLRRVRPVFQGQAGPAAWRFMPELAGSVRIIDAWVDLAIGTDTFVRAGKVKTAVGYERLQSFSQTLFIERGLPSVLTATRDIGVQVHGRRGAVTWQAGVSNGSLDDTDQSLNADLSGDDYEADARVFVEPFKSDPASRLAGLGFGFAGSIGTESTTILDGDRDRRIVYRTSGRNAFFRYNDGVAVDGTHVRLNPHASFYRGPWGLLAEWVRSRYELARADNHAAVNSDAWTIQAGWVVTGEKAGYAGMRPRRPFAIGQAGWGALELAIRHHTLKVGDEAFRGPAATRLARSTATQRAEASAIGANWYLTDNLLLAANVETTRFTGLGARRDTEDAILTRLQIDF